MRWTHLKSAPVTIAEPFNSSLPLTNGIKCKTAPDPAAPAALPAAAAAVVMRGSEADGDAVSADVDAAAAAAAGASLDVTRGLGLVIVERSQLGETVGNTLAEKALNAQNAGAQAVLIVNVDGRVMIDQISSGNHSKRVRCVRLLHLLRLVPTTATTVCSCVFILYCYWCFSFFLSFFLSFGWHFLLLRPHIGYIIPSPVSYHQRITYSVLQVVSMY